MAALLALNQGNFYMLEQYGEGLANVLQITGQPVFSPIDKLKAIMVTAKGIPEPYMVECYGSNRSDYRGFKKLFIKIFGSAYEKGMALHTFLTLPLSSKLHGLHAKSSSSGDEIKMLKKEGRGNI